MFRHGSRKLPHGLADLLLPFALNRRRHPAPAGRLPAHWLVLPWPGHAFRLHRRDGGAQRSFQRGPPHRRVKQGRYLLPESARCSNGQDQSRELQLRPHKHGCTGPNGQPRASVAGRSWWRCCSANWLMRSLCARSATGWPALWANWCTSESTWRRVSPQKQTGVPGFNHH